MMKYSEMKYLDQNTDIIERISNNDTTFELRRVHDINKDSFSYELYQYDFNHSHWVIYSKHNTINDGLFQMKIELGFFDLGFY